MTLSWCNIVNRKQQCFFSAEMYSVLRAKSDPSLKTISTYSSSLMLLFCRLWKWREDFRGKWGHVLSPHFSSLEGFSQFNEFYLKSPNTKKRMKQSTWFYTFNCLVRQRLTYPGWGACRPTELSLFLSNSHPPSLTLKFVWAQYSLKCTNMPLLPKTKRHTVYLFLDSEQISNQQQ